MGRFYIYDCRDRIVGNPKGYRTMRGAIQQQNKKGSPAWCAIREAFEENKKVNPNSIALSAIRLNGRAA